METTHPLTEQERAESLALFHEIRAIRIIAAPPFTPQMCRRLELMLAGPVASPHFEKMFIEGLSDMRFASKDAIGIVSSFFLGATAAVIANLSGLKAEQIGPDLEMVLQRADGTQIVPVHPDIWEWVRHA